ncbi:hypothetical protein [Ketogulonicigenium vulgare]|uniref:hypothetical protein n=1 Tax=Ketogulonicigenium vulgare TaxID=92945 RepID=UPI0023599BB3|nr:hypothetical protein [Ketogulonicigenium vulgare]
MQKFFVSSFAMLINIGVVVGAIFVVIGAISAFAQTGNLFAPIAMLGVGFVGIVGGAGTLYVLLGIYDSTRATYELLAEQARQK